MRSCSSTCATATAPRARARTSTRRRRTRARTATTSSSGSRAQPWSNGRVGTVGSSYAGQVQIRTALERPPHLTAIWPDVVTTNNYANCAREGGAMQGHMFWALFIHAQDAQEVLHDPALSRPGLGRPEEPAGALPGDAVAARADLAAPRARARADADRLLHARRLRRVVGPDRVRLHRLLRPPRGRPHDGLLGLVRPVGGARRRLLRGHGGAERRSAAARDRPVEPRRHARRRDAPATRSTSGPTASGAWSGTSRSSSSTSRAGSPTTRRATPRARRRSGSS